MILWDKKQILRDILEEKKASKQRAEAEALARRDEIAQRAPIYARLDQELARIRAHLAQDALSHPGEQERINEEGRRQVLALRDRAREELKSAGFSPEDLKPHYDCPLCQDTGFVGPAPQRRCTCVERELQRRLYALGGGSGQSFQTFDLSRFPDEPGPDGGLSQRKRMEKMRELALRYVDAFPNYPKRDILLSGTTGQGKTFLLNCISLAVLERGFTVLRISAFDMFELMRQYHRDGEISGMETMLNAQLLAIDDLGSEPMMQNITKEYLFTLLTERKEKRLNTLIATNLDTAALMERYSDRIFSRLTDRDSTMLLTFQGKDLRRL